jgi:cob(I)alamin adenosyltransferase
VKIYTRKGDDGTTGLLYGGRVRKNDPGPEAYGTVDEAVAALGVARSHAPEELADRILELQRDLFVVAAELATDPTKRHKLEPGTGAVTPQMVERLEAWIDEAVAEVGTPEGFMVPGQETLPATLDLARAVIRRAERRTVAYGADGSLDGSSVIPYLNRLADYVYMLVRACETDWEPSRTDDD